MWAPSTMRRSTRAARTRPIWSTPPPRPRPSSASTKASGRDRRTSSPSSRRCGASDRQGYPITADRAHREEKPHAPPEGRRPAMTLALRSVSKTFNGLTVLHGASFDLDRGQVRALVGQNGSGKSTIIKLLAGYHQPDPGSVATIDGRSFELGDSTAARAAGLRFVHQDLALVLTMSVLDNMMLGLDYPRGLAGRIRWREAADRVRHHLSRLGVEADPHAPIGSLTMAERTAVAVARVLADTGDDRPQGLFIVLDEPTAALPQDEVGRLLQAIRALRDDGHGVLLVSHHLNEVLDVADSVTVLRDGHVVAEVAQAELD